MAYQAREHDLTKRDALKGWSIIADGADTIDDAIVTISPAVAQRWLTFRKAFDLTPDLMSLETTVFDDEESWRYDSRCEIMNHDRC